MRLPRERVSEQAVGFAYADTSCPAGVIRFLTLLGERDVVFGPLHGTPSALEELEVPLEAAFGLPSRTTFGSEQARREARSRRAADLLLAWPQCSITPELNRTCPRSKGLGRRKEVAVCRLLESLFPSRGKPPPGPAFCA